MMPLNVQLLGVEAELECAYMCLYQEPPDVEGARRHVDAARAQLLAIAKLKEREQTEAERN